CLPGYCFENNFENNFYIREHHTRANLSPVEDSMARNVLPRNNRGCSRLEGEEHK
ncbi:hypothetical protein Tco_0469880, partial [Tanacetum coccineum]